MKRIPLSLRFIPFLLLLLASGSLAWWQPWADQHNTMPTLYGNVDIREVQLAFRAAGRLDSMVVEEGEIVSKGAVLARLDARPLRNALSVVQAELRHAEASLEEIRSGARPQEISQARAKVRAAESAFANADKEAERQQSLLKTRSTSELTSDRALAARDQTAAQLTAARQALILLQEGASAEEIAITSASLLTAQARLTQAETQLSDATLQAPEDGIIASRLREPGSLVSAGQPVYTLSLTDKIFVRAYVPETALASATPGSEVLIETDSTSQQYHGRIGFVSPRAEFTPKSVETPELRTDLVYRVRIQVLDADHQLRQGMPVTVKFNNPSALDSRCVHQRSTACLIPKPQ